MGSRGIRAQRCGAIIDRAGVAEKLARIVDNLKSRGNSRPRKRSTLASSINSLFQKTLEPCEVDGLIKALQKERYITLEGEAVTYDFSRT
jgi:ribosomal protein S19E (S16A)